MLEEVKKFEDNLALSLSEAMEMDPTVNQLEQDQQLKELNEELKELKTPPTQYTSITQNQDK